MAGKGRKKVAVISIVDNADVLELVGVSHQFDNIEEAKLAGGLLVDHFERTRKDLLEKWLKVGKGNPRFVFEVTKQYLA